MKILVVDDEKIRHELLQMRDKEENEYSHAYTLADAERLLAEDVFDLVRLDYDLKDARGTGMSVVQLLIKLPPERRPKNVICHSLNCYRRATMAKLLDNNGIDAVAREFE